jgi:hypothetical protein
MKSSVLVLAASVSICTMGGMSASAQQPPATTVQQEGMPGGGMMRGMMRGRMMGHRAMMRLPFRIIFALMDTDGDGTVSLSEFQAAHEKIFKAMDANKDGVLTLEEMHAFICTGAGDRLRLRHVLKTKMSPIMKIEDAVSSYRAGAARDPPDVNPGRGVVRVVNTPDRPASTQVTQAVPGAYRCARGRGAGLAPGSVQIFFGRFYARIL